MRLGAVILAAALVSIPVGSTEAGICNVPPGSHAASWSADGSTLAATVARGSCQFWRTAVIDREGSFRWFFGGTGGRDLSWAPDGRRLVVTALTSALPDLTVYETAGTDEIGTRIGQGWNAAWSPDGALIAYTHWRDGVHVVAPDGRTDRKVAAGARPAWSPESKRLAYEREGSVFTANADGSAEAPLARGQRPVWSPDGSVIGLERDGVAVFVRVDRTSEQALGRGRIVSWSPDASEVLLLDDSGVARLVSLRTGLIRRLAEDVAAAAAPRQWDRIATVLTAGRQSEIYLADISGARPSRVTPSQCEHYKARCFEGSDRADRIRATYDRDVIFPGAGDDRVWGGGGDDRIDTAYGRDFVDAGADNDIVFTHGNDDRIYGGYGIDHLYAGNGEDFVDAGRGRDTIFVAGDGRVDSVRCGAGKDIVFADPVDKVARDCEGIRPPPS